MNACTEFAARLTAMGFAVYIAERGSYGFVTDATASRVLSFSFNDGGRLSGNYGPPSTSSGTGWGMEGAPWDLKTAEDVREALYATPPAWCKGGWRYFSTVAQHLATYQASSRYRRWEPDHAAEAARLEGEAAATSLALEDAHATRRARIAHLQALRLPGPVDLGPEDNARPQDELFAELAELEALEAARKA